MINWKNTAENIGILLIGVVAGTALGYYVSVTTAERMLEAQKSIIELAIKKETTSITNQVRTEIRKIKARKGSSIQLVIEPTMKSEIEQQETNNTQIAQPEEKSNFFKRIFNKKERQKHRRERKERRNENQN